jgi:hypothetical protein
MFRINIWMVIAILLVLFAVTRYLMHERQPSRICALALRWVAATRFSSLFLPLLAQWRLSEGCNVFREPVGTPSRSAPCLICALG